MQVDTILAHGTVITLDDAFTLIEDGAVALRGDSIVDLGPADRILRDHTAAHLVDCHHCAIIPGLVNAHTHVPMTLLRGLADDLRLDVWLMGYMMPVEREFVTPDFVRLGTLLGCAEMIRSGVTSFADMYYFEDAIAEATVQAGLRGVLAQTVLKFPAPDAASYEDSVEACRLFIEKWKGHALIVPAVGPHAHYTCPPEVLEACVALATEYNVPLHTHVSETVFEVEESRKEHGMPVVPWIRRHGLLETQLIAAHCVHVDSGEIRTLKNAGAGIVHNPSSNLKLASGIAPIKEMIETGLKLGLGTDGTASNNDLDMFEEMRLASFLAKGATHDPLTVPARTTLMLATRGGARAIHLDHLTGSLEVGKRADVVVVDLTGLHNTPRFHREPELVYSQLVYACKANDVRDVWCNGQALMRDRALLTIELDEVLAQAQEVAQQIDAFLVAREGNLLDKLIAIGGLNQEEMFEVQVKVAIDNPDEIDRALKQPPLSITRSSRRNQYDTYFLFAEAQQGRIRYREDEIFAKSDEVSEVRYLLTYTQPAKEREFTQSVLLSRARFTARADRSLRFYREYFRPSGERAINKERRRYHIIYQETAFMVNVDRITQPELPGYFMEIKSRTWSPRDAEKKARLISELLSMLPVDAGKITRTEYVEISRKM
ncbi:5-methylthioadenosine/S-adenosylhomocysteine deaminase [Thermoflexales bacterium]|nr:5-methylthioadenosine/S-adenosylhomocysteine deaminase [Thermoflexales bacterium]